MSNFFEQCKVTSGYFTNRIRKSIFPKTFTELVTFNEFLYFICILNANLDNIKTKKFVKIDKFSYTLVYTTPFLLTNSIVLDFTSDRRSLVMRINYTDLNNEPRDDFIIYEAGLKDMYRNFYGKFVPDYEYEVSIEYDNAKSEFTIIAIQDFYNINGSVSGPRLAFSSKFTISYSNLLEINNLSCTKQSIMTSVLNNLFTYIEEIKLENHYV